MSNPDTYLALCTQVYDLSKPKPLRQAYQFYKYFVSEALGPVLEPMCGTGRFLLPLLRDGFEVEGFDLSEHMLRALRRKAEKQGLSPNVWQSSVEDLKTDKKYNLIFLPSGSFGLIIDENSAITILKAFYEALNLGGKLIFEVETLKASPKKFGAWRSHAYKCENDKIIIANYLDVLSQNSIIETICKYELVSKNKIIKTEIEDIKVRLYEPDYLSSILEKVGFSEIKQHKAFEIGVSPGENDSVVIFECVK